MDVTQSIPEMVATAQANAKASEVRISEILTLMDGPNGSDAQQEDLRAATVSLERIAVDIFSFFEARMQHHFRRGPFSRKLKTLLLESGQSDLAERFYQYYLAINVLKHGKGTSYRELLNAPNSLVVLRQAEDIVPNEARTSTGLVDVTVKGFSNGLTTTLLEAHHFLENR